MSRWWLYSPLLIFVVLGGLFLYVMRSGLDTETLSSQLLGQHLPSAQLASFERAELVDPSQLAVDGPFLLNVWATWCPACYDEHPVLNKLAAQGVRIAGLNYQDDLQAAERWLIDLHNPYFINLIDADGNYGFDLGVYGAPETFFIDGDGRVRHRQVGEFTEKMWHDNLRAIWEAL